MTGSTHGVQAAFSELVLLLMLLVMLLVVVDRGRLRGRHAGQVHQLGRCLLGAHHGPRPGGRQLVGHPRVGPLGGTQGA